MEEQTGRTKPISTTKGTEQNNRERAGCGPSLELNQPRLHWELYVADQEPPK